MKKLFSILFLSVLFVCSASAQSALTTNEVKIAPEGTADLVLSIDHNEKLWSVEFFLTLPSGVTADMSGAKVGEIVPEGFKIDPTEKNGGYLVGLYPADFGDATFTDVKGTIITIPLAADATVTEGTLDGAKITGISYVNLDGDETKVEDVTFSIEVGEATGINGISLDDPNAEVYNLNGQRVKNVSKGVYVVNGKKVAIK